MNIFRNISFAILVMEGLFLLGFLVMGILYSLIILSELSFGGYFINTLFEILSSLAFLYCLISVFLAFIWVINKKPQHGNDIKLIWWVGIWLGIGLSILSIIALSFNLGTDLIIVMFFSVGPLFAITFIHTFVEYKLQKIEWERGLI
ncbi:MAG: hypothetical protein HRU38_10630 [Saccharospirillaceae bacterium]|nr:hypothetical protein [Pseudomonadales bacterium]NRB79109.1 hypothetical protein [Saccharospirillaceae bacterium]